MPTRDDFEKELKKQLSLAKNQGREYKIITSGELHKLVGDYPGSNHRMPICCSVMRNQMSENDIIISQPPKGDGASLQIKYNLI